MASGLLAPDVIVASMPPLELARAGVCYGKANNVPVIVDIRDLWPDIFLEIFPKPLLWAGKLAVSPFYAMLRESAKGATGISGVSEHAVDWALAHAGKARDRFDGQLPLAYEQEDYSAEALGDAGRFWDARGVTADSGALNICFLGNLTKRIEFDTVLEAARLLPESLAGKVRFILCGAGDRADDIARCAAETKFMLAPGFINGAQIAMLMQRSQIGLLPYPSSDDYVRLMPNKFFDYLGGGLPILTSLTGHTGDTITRNGAGWIYRNNDAQDLVRIVLQMNSDRAAVTQAARHSAELATQYAAKTIYGAFRKRLAAMVAAARG